jgi:hypothetical protein
MQQKNWLTTNLLCIRGFYFVNKASHNNLIAIESKYGNLVYLSWCHKYGNMHVIFFFASMQYKIPVQIENEDPIFLGLSLRQLGIIMGWGGIAYTIYGNLSLSMGNQWALFVSGFIVLLAVFIAIFKSYEMTFVPFVLNIIRISLTNKERIWSQGVESFSLFEIGYVTPNDDVKNIAGDKTLEITGDFQDKLKRL